jgi:hypothetical protein
VWCCAGDRFQLVWVTSHADLLKEAEADGYTEKSLPGQVGVRLATAICLTQQLDNSACAMPADLTVTWLVLVKGSPLGCVQQVDFRATIP